MKLSLVLANWIKDIGAKNVFGVTGGSVVHLLHGVEEVGLNVIYTHHEQAASFAASAATRLEKNISVCMVTTGPGGTNALTGLASAWLDSIPCLFISGQARSEDAKALQHIRQSGSQHLDITNVVSPITKSCYQIKENPNEINSILKLIENDLFNERPGPVWLDIPLEFQWADIKSEEKIIGTQSPKKEKFPDIVNKDISLAKRPVFVLGYGCRLANKHYQFINFCKKHRIPYVLTWNTLDYSSYEEPENCGLIGISGTRDANLVIEYSDLVIGIGTHLSKMLTGDSLSNFASNAKTVYILDIDKDESIRFENNQRYKYINYDLKTTDINSISSPTNMKDDWINLYTKLKNLRDYEIINECQKSIPPNSINQYSIYNIFNNKLKDDDVLVIDGGGNVLFSALQSIKLKNNNRLITGAGIGCMGSGIPEAIGAAFATNKRVFCFIGDGSFQFNIQELQTIKHHNLNIIIILFNNDGYLAIKNTQDSFFERRFGVDSDSGLSLPNFEKVVKAYDLKYTKLQKDIDEQIFNKIIETCEGPQVIEILISEKTPLLPRGGFKKDINGNNVRRRTWDMIPSVPNLPDN